MSRAESGGRRGRRGGTRRAGSTYGGEHPDDYGRDLGYDPEEDFSAEYGHTHARHSDPGDDYDQPAYEYDDYPDDGYEGDGYEDDGYGDDPVDGDAGGPRRRGGRGKREAAGNKKVSRVSSFSASAIQRVSVLGDRPNQIVHTLAAQSTRKRGTAMLGLLLGAFGLSLIALLGLLSYQLYAGNGTASGGEDSIVAPPEGHSTLTPELYLHEPNRDDTFGVIDERDPEAEPMTDEAVFGQVDEVTLGDMELQLREGAVHDSCTSMVWGEDLAQSLLDGDCVNAASGLYTDGDEEYVAQVTLFDLSDSDAAADVAEALDSANADTGAGFLLAQTGGEVPGLEDGYSQATTQVMGHYLAVFWSARTDGTPPGDDSDMATLNVASMEAVRYVYEEVVASGGGTQEEEEG